MRNADCGLRNRNAEDSYETEEESSVRSNGRRSIPHSAIRDPHFLRLRFLAAGDKESCNVVRAYELPQTGQSGSKGERTLPGFLGHVR